MTKRHTFDILTVSSCCSVDVYVCNLLKVIKLWLFLLEKHLLQNCSQMKQSAYKSPFCSKTLFTCWILFSQKRSPDWSYCFAWTEDRALHLKKKFGHVALNIYLFTRSIGWYWEIFQQIYMTSWTNFYWYPLIHILEVNNWLQLGRVSVSLNKQ